MKERGLDINGMNAYGETALHFAARYRNVTAIEQLLAWGVNADVVTILTGFYFCFCFCFCFCFLFCLFYCCFHFSCFFISFLNFEFFLNSFLFSSDSTPFHYALRRTAFSMNYQQSLVDVIGLLKREIGENQLKKEDVTKMSGAKLWDELQLSSLIDEESEKVVII